METKQATGCTFFRHSFKNARFSATDCRSASRCQSSSLPMVPIVELVATPGSRRVRHHASLAPRWAHIVPGPRHAGPASRQPHITSSPHHPGPKDRVGPTSPRPHVQLRRLEPRQLPKVLTPGRTERANTRISRSSLVEMSCAICPFFGDFI